MISAPTDTRSEADVRRPSPFVAHPVPGVWRIALLVLTLAAFRPVLEHDFVAYDDDLYVTQNPELRRGIDGAFLRWAMTDARTGNVHPLTWISHAIDVRLFGLDARGHHLTSLLLHAANVLLLFEILRRTTGVARPSGLVAALFAIHPLHVESVAWIAERKDLLSTLFGFAAILAYVRWTERPSPWIRMAIVAAFAASLAAKPMLVTLPFILLLLDEWPLGRLDGAVFKRIHEKLPLILLSAVASVVAIDAQGRGGAIASLETYPVDVRAANAFVAAITYVRQLALPFGLAVFYPHPGHAFAGSQVAVAAIALVAITALALRMRRRAPFFAVGWVWFLVTLVPVVGLVQIGWQSMADRYTYVPYVGLFVIVAWGGEALAERSQAGARGLAAAATCWLVVLFFLTRSQLAHWRDSETLFRHALAVTADNFLAHNNLGFHLNEQGRAREAMLHLNEALRIRSDYPEAQNNLGKSLFLLGRLDDAAAQFEAALLGRPDAHVARNLALTRLNQGELDAAIRLYGVAAARAPSWAAPHADLGMGLLVLGDLEGAVEELERAVALDPDAPEPRVNLEGVRALRSPRDSDRESADRIRVSAARIHHDVGRALHARARTERAAAHFRRALDWTPGDLAIRNDLGAALGTLGRHAEAAVEFRAVLASDPRNADAENNLGFALLQQGEIDRAREHFRAALAIRPDFVLARANLAIATSAAR